ncbi:MAG: hypothetical protein JXP34_11135 [Planctomycetes bacterium]|nr:hypothetical protein [Planctomycetota bacterium]
MMRTGIRTAAVVLSLAARILASDVTIARDGTGYAIALEGQAAARFELPSLGGAAPRVAIADAGDGWRRVGLRWTIDRAVAQDELAVAFDLRMRPDFHWAPHLAPEPGFVIGQHVFRAPALIVAEKALTLAIVPDLALVGRLAGNPWFLDLDAPARRLWLGMTQTDIPVHVGFKKKPGMRFEPGEIEIAFFAALYRDEGDPRNPWARVSSFLWGRHGHPLFVEGEPNRVPMDVYVRHTYRWAFDGWKHAVWQEFDLGGRRVGAPQFIVNVSQSPGSPEPWFQREFLSIWNQAWFSSLRSASGLLRWARRAKDEDLAAKARLTKELALAAPMKDGIFPAVIRTDNETIEVEGKKVVRPKPWSEAYWTNSNRCPRNFGITPDWYHTLDASWTAFLMLRWNDEIEADSRLVAYARRYADKLLRLQDPQGFFPGWLHPETLEPGPVMNRTPETSQSVTFLLALAAKTGEEAYRKAALRAMDAVIAEIIPAGRWEDYETYWSCSGFGRDTHVGKKYERNDLHKQNTLSIFWTAEALLASYRATKDPRYLRWGRRTIDELSMFQQVWQAPFIYVPALGGFAVMNFDGEWNDSRESLFAEIYLDYYRETGDPYLFERGIAALRSSFIMMYCPENPHVKTQYEKRFPFFGPADYGFTMENYGHGGRTSPEGVGIGVFTIYDWGNGAASEARNRIFDRFGDVYVDRARGHAFGVDPIAVEKTAMGWKLTDLAGRPRPIKVVFADGASRTIVLAGSATIE